MTDMETRTPSCDVALAKTGLLVRLRMAQFAASHQTTLTKDELMRVLTNERVRKELLLPSNAITPIPNPFYSDEKTAQQAFRALAEDGLLKNAKNTTWGGKERYSITPAGVQQLNRTLGGTDEWPPLDIPCVDSSAGYTGAGDLGARFSVEANEFERWKQIFTQYRQSARAGRGHA